MSCKLHIIRAINLKGEEIENKLILEVGSYNVNGSLRLLIESYCPLEYIGVDIEKGPGVDILCYNLYYIKLMIKEKLKNIIRYFKKFLD